MTTNPHAEEFYRQHRRAAGGSPRAAEVEPKDVNVGDRVRVSFYIDSLDGVVTSITGWDFGFKTDLSDTETRVHWDRLIGKIR